MNNDSVDALLELAEADRRVIIRVRRLIRQGKLNEAYRLLGSLENEFTKWIQSLDRIQKGGE